ncbi:MAG: hypothetical protein O6923_05005, partial [Actinobacteria bacterium]|nr:hypothetical protein [Actinomycetota bacterium]
MASRLRIALVAAVVGMLLVPSVRAEAQVFSSCWVVKDLDSFGRPRTVTRCRISGGSVVDYASDSAVPSQLYVKTGTDLTGQCWYYTSAVTQYL